jgi:RNA polymerase sigma-70 factor, ECF subfamily
MDTRARRECAIRREADSLQKMHGTGRFVRHGGLPSPRDDEGLVLDAVIRAREGDADAVRLLYLRHADDVYSYVCSIVGEEHAAEDITQIVFARLEQRLQRYQPGSVPFAAWIIRVARNAAIDYVRAQRLVPSEEPFDHDAETDDGSHGRLEAIREAFSALPADQREVLMLRFVAGLSPAEVARALGRSEPAIHALQHRGRRQLRTELVRLEAGPVTRAA